MAQTVEYYQQKLRKAQADLDFARSGEDPNEIRVFTARFLAAQNDLETAQSALAGTPPSNSVDPSVSPLAAQADASATAEVAVSNASTQLAATTQALNSLEALPTAQRRNVQTQIDALRAQQASLIEEIASQPPAVDQPEDNRNFLQRLVGFTPPPADDDPANRSAFGTGGFRGTNLRIKQDEVVEEIEREQELLESALARGKTDVAANLQASIDRNKAELEQINEGLQETTGVDRFNVDPDSLTTDPPVTDDRVKNTIPQNVSVEDTAASEDININSEARRLAAEAEERAIQAEALLSQARNQATLSEQRKANGTAVGDGDWRVRLRLAPNATYLYKAPEPGILAPLLATDGVIFPYTPQIDIAYRSNYQAYSPTHSNYKHYFYQGSSVEFVTMTANFTAQDTQEAEYLLAVIHFMKSASKMFYGQDADRGSPPPLLYLTGLGEYQFNEAPCVIQEFNYNLPNDVDYIRARSRQISGADTLQYQRPLASSTAPSYSLSAILDRLKGSNLPAGATPSIPAPPNLGLGSPTYVPTKLTMTITLLPVQSRSQVSQQFSLRDYANGNLIKDKGFW